MIVQRVTGEITYERFYQDFLLPNRPVILGSELVKSWPAFHLWTTPPSLSEGSDVNRSLEYTATINWTYLAESYGTQEVSVADCSSCDSFGNLECESSTFGRVVGMWERGQGQSLYVKDWHLARAVVALARGTGSNSKPPTDAGEFYSVPDIFKDDWMNDYYGARTNDDFRFVYVGAAGTYTPLHRDVYCSYSWSTNVCGRKRWWLFPPEQTSFLFMRERNVVVHDVRDVDERQFPEFGKARPVVVDQEAGETIFVPSGWYHQVENLTECISINHNWCNSVNLPMLYASMCDKVVEVERALDDVREMMMMMASSSSKGPGSTDGPGSWQQEFTKVVQDVVKQDAGWNWLTFWRMVRHVLQGIVNDTTSTVDGIQANGKRPDAPSNLRPTNSFIHEKVRGCYRDFVSRDRMECTGEVLLVVEDVSKLLNTIGALS
ncbi:hypothetical protein BDY19DRAFT_978550 [Irpex rosettiformis]|uniref:Uncharacterized protein n=1 Tax=Irpex rosettiformis TaxID=378272 RepID=A0ACB8TN86_9APHY|nr:hypothetical protein BDY19DRAFT_978550 [Irpex rosettiformis]